MTENTIIICAEEIRIERKGWVRGERAHQAKLGLLKVGDAVGGHGQDGDGQQDHHWALRGPERIDPRQGQDSEVCPNLKACIFGLVLSSNVFPSGHLK